MPGEIESIEAWLAAHEQELLSDYREILQIPSLEAEPTPGAPFGPEVGRALTWALDKAGAYGFRTTNLDGYIVYGEIGEGKNLVASFGHLDVVPVSDGWKHHPFGAEIEDGYVYARGAVDDKGATMASFYAIRALKECLPNLKVRVRQVFGGNEESGFRCIDHYAEVDEQPTYGIAPDSDWPFVHGEKGIVSPNFRVPIQTGELEIISIEGGSRPNIVIDRAIARIKVADAAISRIREVVDGYWDRNIDFAWDGSILTLTAHGKAAHGAMPMYGDSAATRVFRFLLEAAPLAEKPYYEELLEATEISGAGLGISGSDEPSGPLTANLGVLRSGGGFLDLTYSVRYPVTWSFETLVQRLERQIGKFSVKWTLAPMKDSRPLYFPLDHPLSKTLLSAYREIEGGIEEPKTMGGGTYARAVQNTVSVGSGFPGDGPVHENDERLKIDHLFRLSRIYARMLYRLVELAAQ